MDDFYLGMYLDFLPGKGVREDGGQGIYDLPDIAGTFLQLRISAFDAGHFQHRVDQIHQVGTRLPDVPGIAKPGFRISVVAFKQLRVAQNGVHRGSDIVGHIE